MSERDQLPRRESSTAFRPVADEGYLVVVPSRSTVEVLNPIGGKIYSMLDGTHTEGEIVRRVMEEFEVGQEQAQGDLREFLSDLRAKGMVVSAGGEAPAESREKTDE